MLELRPVCENCARPLPPAAEDAMICSFECTFCADCVRDVLLNVCPNCGGGFEPRPVRPSQDRKGGNDTAHYPPTSARKHRPVDPGLHIAFAGPVAAIPPARR